MSPTSGTIAPSGSQTLVVTADANGLVAGTYEATITLKTNDPNNTLPTIDVTMNVSGIKRLSASPGTCNFGEVRVGTNASINVTLKNIGSDATTVGSININNAAFTHNVTLPMTVPGFGSRSLQVTFSPTDVGYDSGTMTINSDANDNPVLTVYLNGEGKTVVAAFSGAPKSGSPPLAVSFTDLSSGNVTGWSWTFGDSGTGTEQNPSHTYQSVGNYTVSLEVSGPDGSDTEVKSDYISVR
jgi:PKD repeat protein